MPELAELFMAERSRVITVDGQDIYSLAEVQLSPDVSAFTVHFEDAGSARPQGIRLACKTSRLTMNGESFKEVVLWQDTAPDVVEVELDSPGSRGTLLQTWNVWRQFGMPPTTQAWLRNAGMLLETADRLCRLRCSDGQGPASFTDLVYSVRW